MKKRILPLLLAPALIAGCSTMKNGTSQKVSFKSEPLGVEVYEKTMFGENLLGITPAQIELSKGIGKVMIFKKEGFESKVVVMQSEVDSTSYANAANLMVGDAVDALSGAKYRYKDDEVFVELQPEE